MENYKEKIKKLLALSESSNEHEAKAALLKAKQLMMEHKITESDLVDKKELGVKKSNPRLHIVQGEIRG